MPFAVAAFGRTGTRVFIITRQERMIQKSATHLPLTDNDDRVVLYYASGGGEQWREPGKHRKFRAHAGAGAGPQFSSRVICFGGEIVMGREMVGERVSGRKVS